MVEYISERKVTFFEIFLKKLFFKENIMYYVYVDTQDARGYY